MLRLSSSCAGAQITGVCCVLVCSKLCNTNPTLQRTGTSFFHLHRMYILYSSPSSPPSSSCSASGSWSASHFFLLLAASCTAASSKASCHNMPTTPSNTHKRITHKHSRSSCHARTVSYIPQPSWPKPGQCPHCASKARGAALPETCSCAKMTAICPRTEATANTK